MHKQEHPAEKIRRLRIRLPSGQIDLEIPAGVHHPPASSVELAGLLDIHPGEDVLELACGAGLLSIAAAKLGARRVVATDIAPRALKAAAHNAALNGVAERIAFHLGSWYEALGDTLPGRAFHAILATPPQTPGPFPFGLRYGGRDGTDHLRTVIEGAPARLIAPEGRLWLLAISLANPEQLSRCLAEKFSDVVLVRETERHFTELEYEDLAPGLSRYLLDLRASGRAEFIDGDKGRYTFQNLFIRAAGPRS